MRYLLQLVFLASLAFGQSQSPSLPTTWVDNNELTCQLTSSCYMGSPALTTPYTPPAYELALGANSWTSGPPPSYCTFPTSKPIYAATAAAKQLAIDAIEACRTAGIAHGAAIGIILDVPPGTYTTTTGVVIPQTSNTVATAPLIIRSTMDSTLTSMPEPVCAGGVQDNIPESDNIGLINSDCSAGAGGGTFGYQLGTTVTTLPSGSFTLANGIPTSSSNYNYLQYMYQDECSGSGCIAFQLCSPNSTSPDKCTGSIGPDHWEFEDGAAALSPGNTTDNDIIVTGVTVKATSTSQFASHIHFRRYWSHGDWTSLTAGTNSVSDSFNLSGCYYCSVVGSQVSQALRPGAEGHAILGNGFLYKIENDWLEGESIGVFAGGFSTPPSMVGFVPFQDVQIGRVRETFPYSWLGVGSIPSGNSKWAGDSITRKNCQEFKEGERVLIYGLICENVDNSGGQHGTVTVLDVRNASGTPNTPQNYEATINDVTVQNSIYRIACEGIDLAGRSASSAGNGSGVSYTINRVEFDNILQYGISSYNVLISDCPGLMAGSTIGMQMTNGGGGQHWQGTITENSNGTATFEATCSQDAGGCIGQVASASITNAGGTACTPATGGTLTISASPVTGQTATATYTCTGGTTLSGVTITSPGAYYTSNPTVTKFSGTCTSCAVTLALNASSVSPANAIGFQVMDINAGDPVGVSNCTLVPGFDLATKDWGNGYYWPSQVQALTTAGSAPWSGSFNSAGVTVTYDWTGAAEGAVDNGGYCTLTNGEGGTGSLTFNHMTFITDSTESLGDGPGTANGPTFSRNHTFVNSIMLSGAADSGTHCGGNACGGWWNSQLSEGEGNLTETYNYDTSSMTAAWLVWPGRANSPDPYYEYPNNSGFSDSECSNTTGNWKQTAGGSDPDIGGCNPPNSIYFPATPYCTGASPSYSGSGTGCVGFSGAMSASSMPLALEDYHGYELLANGSGDQSYFHNLASDGTDMGAIIPALDTAQTTTLYVCPAGSCVTSWPFPSLNATDLDTVTINTSPSGLSYAVDGVTYMNQQTFNWMVGSSHTISTTSPQSGTGTQYLFSNWSDSGAQSHSIIAPGASTTYTAYFNTQYQLTTQASPSSDGSVTPVSGGYYAAGTSIPVTATPNSGFAFSNWTTSDGGTFVSSTGASTNFTMPAAPTTITGNFSAASYLLTTTTNPPGAGSVTPVSGGYYAAGTSIPVTATPSGGFAFSNWTTSDGGTFVSSTGASTNFTMPAAPTTISGNFSAVAVASNTGLLSSENPSSTGDPVTFTATVTYGSNSSVGANGSVTFTDNGNPVAGGPTGPVALNANGQASFSTTTLAEGTHSITATYSGFSSIAVAYLGSSATVSQEVDNHTVVNGIQYCNQGAVTLASAAKATPYPSKIFVTGAGASLAVVTLSLNGITSSDIQALNLLLVGPNGKQFVPFANVGDTSTISGVNVTLADAGANPLLTGGPLTTGTFQPSSFIGSGASTYSFASPAPAGPYDFAATDGKATFASEFNTSNPNGTWELFAQTGGSGAGGGSISGGWCLNVSTPVSVTIATVPPGLAVSLDGGTATASPVTITWTVGTTHTIATTSPQSGGTGVQYAFAQWQDGTTSTSDTVTAPTTTATYTATFTAQPSAIYSPANNSTLAGTSATFQWGGYSGATAFWLDIGSTQGGNNYYSSGSLSNTTFSQTVSSLPSNGSTVYATWYYLLNGTWTPNYYSYTALNAAAPAGVLTTPAPSTTLSGSTVTFGWTPGSGAAYWLDIGSSAGGNNYYSSGNLGSALSTTVYGLPTDGSTVYVTLYSLIGGQWFGSPYTYTAVNAAATAGVLTTPAPSTTLSGSTVTFGWTAGSGSTAYWLDIGSSAGGNNYYSSGNLGNVLTVTASGLPTNGSTVYATLYTLVSGMWTPNSYTYQTLSPSGEGVLTTPAPSSTLTGSTVTFDWTAGSPGPYSYWIDVGGSAGGNNYYSSGNSGNVTTTTVNGLPTNGSTVYVTLYTLIGGSWYGNAYTYTAFNTNSGLATMQTPVPGSTLTGTTATFTWSAGSNATAYWVDIGSSAGGNNIYSSGNLGTALSTMVYTLPANGTTIYVSLYSYVGGQWVNNPFTYLSNP